MNHHLGFRPSVTTAVPNEEQVKDSTFQLVFQWFQKETSKIEHLSDIEPVVVGSRVVGRSIHVHSDQRELRRKYREACKEQGILGKYFFLSRGPSYLARQDRSRPEVLYPWF